MTQHQPTVSLIVLNWRRPRALVQVLSGIAALRYPNFEVIVVGDRRRSDDLGLAPELADAIRYVRCPVANISRSRNIGIACARGEIVAFCDDDAVPEPDWLCQLVAPFADPLIGAAGGTVRGPDGLSFQWRGARIDTVGELAPLALEPGRAPISFAPQSGRQAAFMGVNGAFRRAALMQAGGFDESYRYFLDETDVIQRIADHGWHTALVPDAEMVHFQQENAVRGRLSKPRDLYEIGASKAHYCRVHGRDRDLTEVLKAFHRDRRRRIDRFIRIGVMGASERDRLMAGLERGLRDGCRRRAVLPLQQLPVAADRRHAGFQPFPLRRRSGALDVALIAPLGCADRARGLARRLVADGHSVSVIERQIGALAPAVSFRFGVWHHCLPLLSAGVSSRSGRVGREIDRATARRRFHAVVGPADLLDHFARSGRVRSAFLPAGTAAPFAVEFPTVAGGAPAADCLRFVSRSLFSAGQMPAG